jgi:hypothetical protein
MAVLKNPWGEKEQPPWGKTYEVKVNGLRYLGYVEVIRA